MSAVCIVERFRYGHTYFGVAVGPIPCCVDSVEPFEQVGKVFCGNSVLSRPTLMALSWMRAWLPIDHTASQAHASAPRCDDGVAAQSVGPLCCMT